MNVYREKGGQKPLQPLQKGPNLERGQGDVSKEMLGCQSEWGGAPLPVTQKTAGHTLENKANPHPPLSQAAADHTPSRKRVLRSSLLLVPPTLAPLHSPANEYRSSSPNLALPVAYASFLSAIIVARLAASL